jgi:hypothetical protein
MSPNPVENSDGKVFGSKKKRFKASKDETENFPLLAKNFFVHRCRYTSFRIEEVLDMRGNPRGLARHINIYTMITCCLLTAALRITTEHATSL